MQKANILVEEILLCYARTELGVFGLVSPKYGFDVKLIFVKKENSFSSRKWEERSR